MVATPKDSTDVVGALLLHINSEFITMIIYYDMLK